MASVTEASASRTSVSVDKVESGGERSARRGGEREEGGRARREAMRTPRGCRAATRSRTVARKRIERRCTARVCRLTSTGFICSAASTANAPGPLPLLLAVAAKASLRRSMCSAGTSAGSTGPGDVEMLAIAASISGETVRPWMKPASAALAALRFAARVSRAWALAFISRMMRPVSPRSCWNPASISSKPRSTASHCTTWRRRSATPALSRT
mmetsp:Transcript_42113/g.99285  ORF Transcript_42113/g.99285 Transcript_42113/m.99285 type:complete len:213 (-) Transcript_42113:90-728(-)